MTRIMQFRKSHIANGTLKLEQEGYGFEIGDELAEA